MSDSIFKRGFDIVREETIRSEKARENAGKRLYRFFIKAGVKGQPVEVEGRFLTEIPVTFYEHTVVRSSGKYENFVCERSDKCSLCADGDRPSFKGAFLFYDYTPYEDKEGKVRVSGLRLYVQGQKVLSQLDRLSTRYGLTKRRIIVVRTGSGKESTSYTFEMGAEEKLTEAQIREMLPEKLRPLYDGSQDSLVSIVEEALRAENVSPEDNEDEADTPPVSKKLIGVDDDDEKPKKVEESEESEEEAPQTKPKLFKLKR